MLFFGVVFDSIDFLDQFECLVHAFIRAARFEELASSMGKAACSLASIDTSDRVVARVGIDKQCALAATEDLSRSLTAARGAKAIGDQVAGEESPHPGFALGGLQLDAGLGGEHDVASGNFADQNLAERLEQLRMSME